MAFIEGAIKGTGAILTQTRGDKLQSIGINDLPKQLGALNTRYSSKEVVSAYSERNTTKTGFSVGVYDPILAAMLGPELG